MRDKKYHIYKIYLNNLNIHLLKFHIHNNFQCKQYNFLSLNLPIIRQDKIIHNFQFIKLNNMLLIYHIMYIMLMDLNLHTLYILKDMLNIHLLLNFHKFLVLYNYSNIDSNQDNIQYYILYRNLHFLNNIYRDYTLNIQKNYLYKYHLGMLYRKQYFTDQNIILYYISCTH